jgi:hypothetical protein
MSELESLILQILRQMRAELGDVRAELGGVRSDISQIRADFATKSDLRTLRADVASDMLSLRKELSDEIVALRRGVITHLRRRPRRPLISELEARMRRVEQHLNLPSLYPT